MNAKKNSQGGFSLIELLVVVAIMGVIAAAGMVGYTKYIDGVKKDMHVNNARAIAQALKTSGVARVGGLNVAFPECKGGSESISGTGTDAGSVHACAVAIAIDGQFSSPIDKTLTASTLFISGVQEDVTCSASESKRGKLGIAVTSTNGTVVYACDGDGNILDPVAGISIGTNW